MSDMVSIALDLGTTNIKAAMLHNSGQLLRLVSHPAPPVTVTQGRYESDAHAYAAVAERVLSECRHDACITLGMASQRSSFVLWDAATDAPVTPLISWQDGRGAASCAALFEQESAIRKLSGLPLTPYYLAGKLRVLLQENPHWRVQLENGNWRVGTLDSFLIWRWSNGQHFVTDASMAARTQLMDIGTQQWSATLCELFDIPAAILPVILPSSAMNLVLHNGLTLQASVGDQSAALIASLPLTPSEALINLGTGGFVVRPVEANKAHHDGYLSTLIYQDAQGIAHHAREGTLNSIAAALAPYPVTQCEFHDLAQHEIFCLAEPSGLGSPYFRTDLRSAFFCHHRGFIARRDCRPVAGIRHLPRGAHRGRVPP